MHKEAGVEDYLKDIAGHRILTRDEEIELTNKIRNGDNYARETMINSNLKLVFSIAKHYAHRKIGLNDAIEEGNKGLIKAVERFDPSRGYKFSTYATYWIRQAIERVLGQEEKRLKRLEFIFYNMEDKNNFVDSIADNSQSHEEELLKNERYSILEDLMNMLDDRARTIIEMRYGLNGYHPMSLVEIGKRIYLSRERVRLIQYEAEQKLRGIAKNRGLSDIV
ncbi:sigma-70 family RNA polymerase sigma factor [Candidatus Pacearchaeota archaeon]|nr:sigma-70 family RNA polymerase sigma factor [Candidatus Pacearchaeota archaeon]